MRYLTLAEALVIAEAVTDIELVTLAEASRLELLDSALHAPEAGFRDKDFYPSLRNLPRARWRCGARATSTGRCPCRRCCAISSRSSSHSVVPPRWDVAAERSGVATTAPSGSRDDRPLSHRQLENLYACLRQQAPEVFSDGAVSPLS